MKKLICFFILISINNYFYAQEGQFSTIDENVMRAQLESKYTKETYKIDVQIPFGYHSNNNSYPVLYTLDGNVTFGMVSDITKLLYFEKPHSAVIVVGVGYKTYKDWISKREHDLMPTTKSIEGVDLFLKFIKDELIPFVNTNFRTNKKENIIYGHSSAAIFGFYSMFKNPTIFKNYILTSPSVDEDDGYTVQMEKDFYVKSKELNIALYSAMGKSEKATLINSYESFVQQLKSRNYKQLYYQTDILDGTHMSIMAPAFVKGFEYIFKETTDN